MSEQSAHRIWEATLGQLQLQVSRPSFDTWLKDTEGLSFQEDQIVVGVPTTFAAEWLEKRMFQLIEKNLESVLRRPVELRFQVCSNGHPDLLTISPENSAHLSSVERPLDPWTPTSGPGSPGCRSPPRWWPGASGFAAAAAPTSPPRETR